MYADTEQVILWWLQIHKFFPRFTSANVSVLAYVERLFGCQCIVP